jgi:hypothetical protein
MLIAALTTYLLIHFGSHSLAATPQLEQRREKSIDSLNGVLAKRTTPSSAIVSAAQPLITDDSATAEKLLDLRFQLRTLLSESEWAKVFPAPTASRSAAKKAT